VGNTRNAENLCSCCGCGCAMMQLGKRVGSPASKLWSNYRLVYDADACVGCGKCVERCTFKYVKCVGEKVETNMDGCLACGLCVSTCPTGARILERKPDDEVYLPPETLNDAYQMWYDVRQGTVKVPWLQAVGRAKRSAFYNVWGSLPKCFDCLKRRNHVR